MGFLDIRLGAHAQVVQPGIDRVGGTLGGAVAHAHLDVDRARGAEADRAALRHPIRRAVPLAIALVATVVVALGRLVVTPSFYFADDTQTGTAGQWWQLGEALLSGRLPILDVHAWTAGNYLAEGQWGTFNPVIWGFAVLTRLGENPMVTITVVKIAALAVMTAGVYLLTRSFGGSRAWAAAAGVLVPLGGFTVYFDAPSWTTGLLASAVFPWVWWGLRRLVEDGRGPLAFLIPTFVLVTFGYVFGVIMLVLLLGETLVRAIVARDRRRIFTTLGAGAFGALLTVAVYLPGVLTAPVTVRGSTSIVNSGFLNADLTDTLSASTATVTGSIGAWWGEATTAPIMYALWALPALAFFAPSRTVLRRLVPLAIVGAVTLLVVTGPDQIGPIRWPVRFMPYLVLVVVVAFAVIAAEGRRARSPRRAAVLAGVILAGLSWFSAVNTPWEWRQVAISAFVQAVGLGALWLLIFRSRRPHRVVGGATAFVTGAVGAVLVIPQLFFFPASPLPQLGVVTDTNAMAQVPGDVQDDAIVVGDIYRGWKTASTFDERLVANQWYFSDTTVSSLYTVLPHRAYVEDLCADLRGATCPDALDTLTGLDPTTGLDVAQLLGVNTIVVMKASFPDGLPDLAEGWQVAADGELTWVLSREDAVDPAGGVAWTGDGTRVTETSRADTSITLRVDEVGDDPSVVLSRLAWPGYTVSGAEMADSLRGYLLTLDLSDAAAGDVIVVSFHPPGWTLEITCLVIAVLGLVAWPIVHAVRQRRRGTTAPVAS